MKIIVTGSTGFVGKNLVPKLLDQGHIILEITRDANKSFELYGDYTEKLVVNNNIFNFQSELKDFNPEVVIHLAAYLSSQDDSQTVEELINSNIVFLTRLLHSLPKGKIKGFINTGTFAQYKEGKNELNPAYLYAATKISAEYILMYYSSQLNFKHVNIIPYTIYGKSSNDKKLLDLILNSTNSIAPIDLSPGEQILDFIHINDVVECYSEVIQNLDQLSNGARYFLGTGKGTRVKDLPEIIKKIFKKQTNINWGGRPYRDNDIMYAVADTSRLKLDLNWVPNINLKEGLLLTYIDH